MSESSNEFKLTAARDMGLRALIRKMQAFFNEQLFPAMDPELSQLCVIEFSGLDAETREQENERLTQEQPLHMTYDETLVQVDKEPLGEFLGGAVPLNDRQQAVMDKYLSTGTVIANLLKDPSAQFDPLQRFQRDGFYLQHLAMLQEIAPYAVKAAYAFNPMSQDLLKLMLQDLLEEDEIQEDEVEEKVDELKQEVEE
jgi:hypothetical protein